MVTKIQISNYKPEVEECIIQGELNYVNYIYLDDYYSFAIIYSPKKLTYEEMEDIINDDENVYKYF